MTAMHLDDLADRINTVSRLTGTFTLRSGQIATEYFDKYRFEAVPDLLADIAEAMAPMVPEGTEVIAGLEMGGIPIVTALSMRTGIPAAFVRKKAKEYGTARLAEGADIAGKRVTVIEDVITTRSGGRAHCRRAANARPAHPGTARRSGGPPHLTLSGEAAHPD